MFNMYPSLCIIPQMNKNRRKVGKQRKEKSREKYTENVLY